MLTEGSNISNCKAVAGMQIRQADRAMYDAVESCHVRDLKSEQ
jgi:hypothetical protein